MTGSGTAEGPRQLTTAPGSSSDPMRRDTVGEPTDPVCGVGSEVVLGSPGSPAPEPIWHVALLRDWNDAVAVGRYEWSTLGVTLAEQGFVHASAADQVEGVARAFYADVREPLLLLEIDVAAVEASGAPVRWEEVPGADRPFPHVHGPVPVAAVRSVTPYAVGDPVPPPR